VADDVRVTGWTKAQVEAQAPDAASISAARRLAQPGPWSDLGNTATLVWGKCQGSGAQRYQVSVDLTGPAFRCSCPSRKFPCKHGLALMLLWVANGCEFGGDADPAGFAAEWQATRAARSSTRATGAADAGAEPVDPEAREKRIARRVETMTAGLDDFERWLRDLVAHGLASARQRPFSFWDAAAARLVDAQVPGLAERVRDAGGAIHRHADWADHLLAECGRWYLAARAWPGRDAMAPDDFGDLRTYLGWTVSTDEVRSGDSLEDRWKVVGVHRTDDGRLQAQRTWLHGATSGDTVLALDFAAVGGALRVAQVCGSVIDASLARYRGRAPWRVLLPDDATVIANEPVLPAGVDIDGALALVAKSLAENPWSARVGVSLRAVTFVPDPSADTYPDRPGWVIDSAGASLPLAPGVDVWRALARTGGRPIDVFGELDDARFRPLTLGLPDELVPV
jgi:hypothetical protein